MTIFMYFFFRYYIVHIFRFDSIQWSAIRSYCIYGTFVYLVQWRWQHSEGALDRRKSNSLSMNELSSEFHQNVRGP